MDCPPATLPSQLATAANRLLSLDFIRGIAVMGIVWANIIAFGQPMAAYMFPGGFLVPHGPGSDLLWALQFILIDGKMRGLFTLLFGAGLVLFMERAELKNRAGQGDAPSWAPYWLQTRRLFWLLCFGLLHFYFLWKGDILVLYAIAGVAAAPFVRWKATNQLVLGLLGYAVGALMFLMTMLPPYLIVDTALGESTPYALERSEILAFQAEEIADGLGETAIIRGGDYADFVRHNLTEHRADPLSSVSIFILETLPLMLIGMALYQMGLFSGQGISRIWRLWGWGGILSGSVLTLIIALWALTEGLTYWGTLAAIMGLSPVPKLLAILGLAVLLAALSRRMKGALGARVTAAGRMAFSNYIGTSFVMLLVFHGWAGGLFGYLDRPQLYGVAAASNVLMLVWSKPWLARFHYGPLEWLWRCLTYWRIFPLRKRHSVLAIANKSH